MIYKLAVRYRGDCGYASEVQASEVQAESYTEDVKLELLSKATRMINFPEFGWQILDKDNNIMNCYNWDGNTR